VVRLSAFLKAIFMRLLLIILAAVFFFSCKKDSKKEEIDLEAPLKCTSVAITDTNELASLLPGTWKLLLRACPLGAEQDLDVEVNFTGARTYEIKENGVISSTGTWRFQPWGNDWALKSSEFNIYFFGEVSSCENKLIIIGQPLDGCNHYFRKNP
jgi:hypothetical protein